MIQIVITILLLLYLLIGTVLFYIGLRRIGGKDQYINYLRVEEKIEKPKLAYCMGIIIFVCSWPMFIHKGTEE